MPGAEKHLYIKKSQLPDSGNGLFTGKEIKKGTQIVEYTGKIMSWKEVADDSENGYIFMIDEKTVIDAFEDKKALARYANDAKGLTRVKGLKNNSEYIIRGKKCFIEAKRKIEKDEEILVGYGKEYWDQIKENIALGNKKKIEK